MNRMKNNKRRMTMLFFLGIFIANFLHAEEDLAFVADRDIVARGTGGIESMVNAGDIINSNARVGYFRVYGNTSELDLQILFDISSKQFGVLARDFFPTDTEDTFSEDIFINYPVDRIPQDHNTVDFMPIVFGDTDKMWVPVYYRDVLASLNRDSLIQILPRLSSLTEVFPDHTTFWYQYPESNIQHGRAMFFNSVIGLGNKTNFAVRNIKREDFGYRVDAVLSTAVIILPVDIIFPESTFWKNYGEGDALTLLLNLDGDYLDISVEGSGIKIGTFIRVGREFIAQYQSLIRTDTADLTNVQWPRRADGSTGFPPPGTAGLDFQASHRTTDRLRVRETPTTDSQIVTTLDTSTQVQVLETGTKETIGGITAPWVKVLAENGFTGWAFSGYLEPLAPKVPVAEKPVAENQDSINQETQNPEVANPERENVETQNLEAENQEQQNPESSFPVLPFAIIGGIILVSGIVVAVVLAKRRNRNRTNA